MVTILEGTLKWATLGAREQQTILSQGTRLQSVTALPSVRVKGKYLPAINLIQNIIQKPYNNIIQLKNGQRGCMETAKQLRLLQLM